MRTKTWKDAYDERWKNSNGFSCSEEELTSLEGAPSRVDGNFECDRNSLTFLNGAPSYVGGYFDCSYNRITSIKEAPVYVGKTFFCTYNRLTSLKNIHLYTKHIGLRAYFHYNPIKSHVLGLLLIDGLQEVLLDDKEVEIIINKHLPSKGMESVLEAQDELITAGFEEYAQL